MDIRLSKTSNKTIAVFIITNIIISLFAFYAKLMDCKLLIQMAFFVFITTVVIAFGIIFREEIYKYSQKYLSKKSISDEEFSRIRKEQKRRRKNTIT